MTVRGCDERCRPPVLGGTAAANVATALLGALLLVGAACDTKDYDREAVLNFKNAAEGDSFRVKVRDAADNREIGEQEIGAGVTGVRVRFTGLNGDLKITIVVHHLNGQVCASFEVEVKSKGSFELTLDVATFTCTLPPDAGTPPPPDAGPPAPDAQPDTTPDWMPDLGPPPECQEYCTVMADRCPSVYLTPAECLNTCQAFGWPSGPPDSFKNDLGCRMAIAKAAPKPDELAWCRAAGPSGGNYCGAICRNLCETTAAVCPGALPGGSLESCLAAPCDPYKTGPIRAESGDTNDCRFHWLSVAAQDGRQSCARLAPDAPDYPCR
jgi:hypothetical protein